MKSLISQFIRPISHSLNPYRLMYFFHLVCLGRVCTIGKDYAIRAKITVIRCISKISVWLLGSSLYSAQLAAQLGLPFAFASHFAPDMLFQALHLYRSNFKPSARLEKPYAMVCINIIAADSNRDAEFLFTSMQQAFVKLRRGETGQLPPPIQNMDQFWSPSEQYGVQQALSMSLVGDKAKVRHGLQSILRETDADEIMVNGQIFDHQARLHSFELAMDVKEELLG